MAPAGVFFLIVENHLNGPRREWMIELGNRGKFKRDKQDKSFSLFLEVDGGNI